jgi:hypothetical protein
VGVETPCCRTGLTCEDGGTGACTAGTWMGEPGRRGATMGGVPDRSPLLPTLLERRVGGSKASTVAGLTGRAAGASLGSKVPGMTTTEWLILSTDII